MQFPGVMDFVKKYQTRAPAEGVDLLGYFSQGPNAGLLVSDTSFGAVVASALSLDASGQPQLSATFAAIELQSKGLTNAGSQTVGTMITASAMRQPITTRVSN